VPTDPSGVDVNSNIAEAIRPFIAKNQVQNKIPWDYKQIGPAYEAFGNFNYGATGADFGFSEDTLLRVAGWAQVQARSSQSNFGVAPNQFQAYSGIGGVAPFGDDPNDQKWISRGIRYCQGRK
jgi:hypothetical protein